MINTAARYVTPELLRPAGLDRKEDGGQGHGGAAEPAPGVAYPLIMQRIVEALARTTGNANE